MLQDAVMCHLESDGGIGGIAEVEDTSGLSVGR